MLPGAGHVSHYSGVIDGILYGDKLLQAIDEK
jgi:hypothetical protein